jgi:NADPH:quinone reductase-like Zn-dependent oxidoreductase
MERLEYDRYGGPELVHLNKFTLPQPTADELVIRVAAASINPMDWKIRSGQMRMFIGSKFPRAMGADFSGTVEAVGSKVSRFKPGDAVVGTAPMKGSGAFAPKLITSQKLVVKKPDDLSFAEAASLPIAGVTAWLVLVKKARLRRGQKLFINGALGAVGQATVAIARGIGADVAGRVGRQSIAQAQLLGLSPVLDYTKPLPPSLDGAYDVVFDCNGSLSPHEAERLKKPGGMIIDIVPTGPKFLKALISWSHKVVIADLKAENLQHVVDLAAAGKLAIPIARTISLADAPALLASLERGERLNGKAMITFEGPNPRRSGGSDDESVQATGLRCESM